MIPSIAGYRVIESLSMIDTRQVRFPRSKKKRIRKKWSKRQKNWKSVPREDYYIYDGNIVGHPYAISRLRAHMENQDAS